MNEDKPVDRRGFMSIVTWAIGGLITAAMGIPGVAYVLGPALQNAQVEQWIRLGSTSKVELGTPTLFKAKVQRKPGWGTAEDELAVFGGSDNGRDFIAMSNICTHLGCRVRWIAERQQFLSPCHNGVFDKYGNVVSGPPPRPLDEFETKIEDGNLFIQLPAIKRTS